jgi:hypothetical protein
MNPDKYYLLQKQAEQELENLKASYRKNYPKLIESIILDKVDKYIRIPIEEALNILVLELKIHIEYNSLHNNKLYLYPGTYKFLSESGTGYSSVPEGFYRGFTLEIDAAENFSILKMVDCRSIPIESFVLDLPTETKKNILDARKFHYQFNRNTEITIAW